MENLFELIKEKDKEATVGRHRSSKLSRQFEEMWPEILLCRDNHFTLLDIWTAAKNAGRFHGDYSSFRKRVKRRQEKKGEREAEAERARRDGRGGC
jgi:hypothetical protein